MEIALSPTRSTFSTGFLRVLTWALTAPLPSVNKLLTRSRHGGALANRVQRVPIKAIVLNDVSENSSTDIIRKPFAMRCVSFHLTAAGDGAVWRLHCLHHS